MKVPGHLADDVVGRQNEDGVAEIAAEEHRPHREVADDDRWYGQRDERNGDHPRTLVRLDGMMAMLIAMLVMMVMGRLDVTEALLAVEGHEEEPERI